MPSPLTSFTTVLSGETITFRRIRRPAASRRRNWMTSRESPSELLYTTVLSALSFKEHRILFQHVTGDEVAHFVLLLLLNCQCVRLDGLDRRTRYRLFVFVHGVTSMLLFYIGCTAIERRQTVKQDVRTSGRLLRPVAKNRSLRGSRPVMPELTEPRTPIGGVLRLALSRSWRHSVKEHALLLQEGEDVLELVVQSSLWEAMAGAGNGDQSGVSAGLFQFSGQVCALIVRHDFVGVAVKRQDRGQIFSHVSNRRKPLSELPPTLLLGDP